MSENNLRPPVCVGHVALETDRMDESAKFMRTIGMRPVSEGPEVSVYELRGGTHLILMLKGKVVSGNAPFDLMVDNLHATHQLFTSLGLPQRQSKPGQQSITRFSVSVSPPAMSSRFSQVMHRAIQCEASLAPDLRQAPREGVVVRSLSRANQKL